MNLLQIRTQFVKTSGRYDLIVDTTDWLDNGANFYLNAGQKYLDRMSTTKKAHAKIFESVVAGAWYSTFQLSRSVEEVWASNSDGEKWRLEKASHDEIWTAYAEDPANIDRGDPLYYCPIYLRRVPETAAQITIDVFGTTEYNVATDHYTYNGLIFMPPAETAITLEIRGLFYTPELVNDTDENYWTVVQPQALLMAGMRQLEVMYRNTEGVKDWDGAIGVELKGLDFDQVGEDIAEIDQMEG